MVLEEWLEIIKNSVFPYFCVGCKIEGEWWCKNCRNKKIEISNRAEGELDVLTALFKYNDDNIGKLIKEFKYGFVRDISKLWFEIIVENNINFPEDHIIVPVPLFKKRLLERGYNQAEVIAEKISKHSGCRLVKDQLKRVRPTEQQAKLEWMERLDNVKGAFEIGNNHLLKKVVLVDDVYTTGATMNECARVLRRSGTEVVKGFVLAHG